MDEHCEVQISLLCCCGHNDLFTRLDVLIITRFFSLHKWDLHYLLLALNAFLFLYIDFAYMMSFIHLFQGCMHVWPSLFHLTTSCPANVYKRPEESSTNLGVYEEL